MWNEIATVEQCLDCRRPFSFYFDLVAPHWKTSSALSNNLTLHRICTLARKQGCNFVAIETALGRDDVREELDALDQYNGGSGYAEAITFSFFAGDTSPAEISTVVEGAIIGTAVLINYRTASGNEFQESYIFEAIMAPPHLLDGSGQRQPLLNNYICRESDFRRRIRGREFSLRGFYFCQQNGKTNVCAHASLRMAINSDGSAAPPLSNVAINTELKLTPPFQGLQIGDIEKIIKGSTKCDPMIVDCSGLSKADYLSVLTSYVQSGCIVLLVFSTARVTDHVVTVFGHTRNSDEWHPEAIPGYSGPNTAPYYTNSSWIDHFIIHDDNLGPYYTLSSRALEVDQSIQAKQIIAIHPHNASVRPHYAEGLAAIILRSSLPNLAGQGKGNWFQYITGNNRQYVMRSILLDRASYQNHLRSSVAHDQTSLTEADIHLLDGIPEWIWMVEFSLPSLFTGNRSKLGEVLISTRAVGAPPITRILGLRLPSLLIVPDNAGVFSAHSVGMIAHSAMYVTRPHGHQW
jgi:hypothetical protein